MPSIPTPYSYYVARHPVFRREARRVRWGWSDERLRRYSLRVLVVVHAVLILIAWPLLAWIFASSPPSYSSVLSNEWLVYNTNFQIIALIILASIGISLILDFVSAQVALNSISGEITGGRWDLLRLTALREEGIVAAKHASSQLRAWRVMAVIVSLRVVSIVMFAFSFVCLPYIILQENDLLADLFEIFTHEPLSVSLLLIVIAFTASIYVIEPYWRMKAMTALGMMISSYVLNTPLAALAGVAAIFAVWLAQAIVVLCLVFGLGAFFSPAIFVSTSSAFFIVLYVFLAALVTAVTIYGFYSLLQTWSLKRVARRILKSN